MKYIKNFLKGIVIGVSTLVPGVSGGTMAIILGIYDKIIHSISNFFKDIKNNTIFLGVVGVGGLIGIFAFSNIIDYGLKNFRFIMIFLFLGIIVGGMPVLFKKAEIKSIKVFDIIMFLIGVILVVLTSFSKSTVVNLASSEGMINMLFMVLAGFIMAVALVLPGISGSFFLLTIGLLELTTSAIKNLNMPYLIPFALGIALGVILTTKALESLMNKHTKPTYLIILGFVIGSIFVIFKDNIPSGIDILYSAIAMIVGYFITNTITRLGKRYGEEEVCNKTKM